MGESDADCMSSDMHLHKREEISVDFPIKFFYKFKFDIRLFTCPFNSHISPSILRSYICLWTSYYPSALFTFPSHLHFHIKVRRHRQDIPDDMNSSHVFHFCSNCYNYNEIIISSKLKLLLIMVLYKLL